MMVLKRRRLASTLCTTFVLVCLNGYHPLLQSLSEARTYEEIEANLEAKVAFHKPTARQLLQSAGIAVIDTDDKELDSRYNSKQDDDLPYFVHYQVGWRIESAGCVGWRPILLMTCSGDGRPVLMNKGPQDSKTDCASTEDSILCMMPIVEDHSSLTTSMKVWETMAFQCRGTKEADVFGAVGFRSQQLTCNGGPSKRPTGAKQGLKMDVIWGDNNSAYSFQCKTVENVLTTFVEGHCMSMLATDESQKGDSGSPYTATLAKRYLTQIEEFFTKNPQAITKPTTTQTGEHTIAQEAYIVSSEITPTPTTPR